MKSTQTKSGNVNYHMHAVRKVKVDPMYATPEIRQERDRIVVLLSPHWDQLRDLEAAKDNSVFNKAMMTAVGQEVFMNFGFDALGLAINALILKSDLAEIYEDVECPACQHKFNPFGTDIALHFDEADML